VIDPSKKDIMIKRIKPLSGIIVLVLLASSAFAQDRNSLAPKAAVEHEKSVNAAADDISGMYNFLGEGEFVQISLEQDGVSGYISRRGDRESDHGAFLDQFFEHASIKDHDVSFTTKPLHGEWFEFKGRYERGAAKTREQDGYYVLRGTLKRFVTDANGSTTSRSRQVEFKLLAQPDDDSQATAKARH